MQTAHITLNCIILHTVSRQTANDVAEFCAEVNIVIIEIIIISSGYYAFVFYMKLFMYFLVVSFSNHKVVVNH